ncbi:MAG: hypothetical protein KIS95_06220 [Anaerolineae bacterium]|uniref:hypothetical protein n=1 Tax=Promineifilum sp. TaxID=2664178 RepID=UPI002411B49A|nr:hypothetical protein [Promineifilum sp.]MCW5846803.1 hypothetical protein [Anaerolineae bacterium]
MSLYRLTLAVLIPIILVVCLLSACGGAETTEYAVSEEVQISCTDECAAHGQCGALDDDTRVVLGNDVGPAVSLHNRLFLDGHRVTVLELSRRELIAARNGAPLIGEATAFPHIFYRVDEAGKTAWVSEWCLARP